MQVIPPKKVLIATLPKSGTWYAHCFFHCYSALLAHYDNPAAHAPPDLARAIRENRVRETSHPHPSLGIETLFICHAICPGYRESGDPLKPEWDRLRFYVPGYNFGEDMIGEDFHTVLSPISNPAARIIYLFRNPLDHMLSYWQHVQHHIQPDHRMKINADGGESPIADFRDFVFNASAIDGFIKHFHTFRIMSQRYPDNILMIPYEDLTAQPARRFAEMLSFMGHAPAALNRQRAFEEALRMTAKDAMRKVEETLGRALANDQTDSAERHIRDGGTGKWRETLAEEDLFAIAQRLNAFELSLPTSEIIHHGAN